MIEGIRCVSYILPICVCSLSLFNFRVIMLLQLHRYEKEEWENVLVYEWGNTREQGRVMAADDKAFEARET